MKTEPTRRRGFTLVELLVVIVIIATLAGIGTPVVLKQRKAAARAEAIHNAKEIGLALMEFEQQYGSFPDRRTAEEVATITGTALNLSGDSANDYLRQLIAVGLQSEEIFFTKTSYTRKPDNVFSGDKALAAGEVGFGYIMKDVSTGQNAAGNPSRTVLATPLLNAASDWTFDPEPFGDKAVVLRIDHSAQVLPIRQTDHKAILSGGRPIEQTGDDSVWGTEVHPVLKAPTRLGS